MPDNVNPAVEPAVTPAADKTPPPPVEPEAERAPEAPAATATRSAAEMIEQLRNETQEDREKRPLLARMRDGNRVHEIRRGDFVYRSGELAKRGVDVEARTVELTFSSETPIDRGWCLEILDHSAGCVRMERMQNAAAVLCDHDWKDQVGVVDDAGLTGDRRHRAKARFGRSVRSSEVFQDVVDGIRVHISVGYFIYAVEERELPGGGLEIRVIDWEPFEISFVAVPADVSVGVGRSGFGLSFEAPVVVNREVGVMPENATMDREAIRKEEQKRQKDIRDLGEKFGQADLATRLIDSGADYDAARLQVLEAIGAARQVTQEEIRKESMIGMSAADLGKFQINRFLLSLADKNPSLAPFERECSDAAAVKMGRTPQGEFLPPAIVAGYAMARAQRLAQTGRRDIASSGTGAYLIGTDHLDGEFIEMLRPVSALANLGARVLDGLVGNIEIPRRETGATFYVINNETTGVTESTPTFGRVQGSPKTVAARVDLTRRMLLQSSPAVNALTMSDMVMGMGTKVDSLGINGDGQAPNPTGLHYVSGIGSVIGGTNGAAPSWDDVVELVTDTAVANAIDSSSGFLISARAAGFFQRTEKASGTAQFIMGDGADRMNGRRVVVSNNVLDNWDKGTSTDVCSALYYGASWSDLLLMIWGSMDLKIDDVTNADYGGMVLRIFQDIDIGFRHPESFSAMKDALCTW